jgi:hypothetical protein
VSSHFGFNAGALGGEEALSGVQSKAAGGGDRQNRILILLQCKCPLFCSGYYHLGDEKEMEFSFEQLGSRVGATALCISLSACLSTLGLRAISLRSL